MSAFLTIKNLRKTFTLHTQEKAMLQVLNGVDLEVNSGEIVALCGPSGAGKSSLLKAVYGTYRVGGGIIHVASSSADVVNIPEASPREIIQLRKTRIGYVSQFLRVIPRVATIDIVASAAKEIGLSKEESASRAKSLLLRLRIPEALHSLSPLTFSGGEQQRVNIARAICAPRPLMLFDEPTASLDPENRATVLRMIRELADANTAILGIFHDPKDREVLGTRDVIMSQRKELEDV